MLQQWRYLKVPRAGKARLGSAAIEPAKVELAPALVDAVVTKIADAGRTGVLAADLDELFGEIVVRSPPRSKYCALVGKSRLSAATSFGASDDPNKSFSRDLEAVSKKE